MMFTEIMCFTIKDAATGNLSVVKAGREGESFVQDTKNRDVSLCSCFLEPQMCYGTLLDLIVKLKAAARGGLFLLLVSKPFK